MSPVVVLSPGSLHFPIRAISIVARAFLLSDFNLNTDAGPIPAMMTSRRKLRAAHPHTRCEPCQHRAEDWT